MDEASRLRTAQRTGRRIGIAVFFVILATFVVVCSAQILYQGFNAPDSASATDCRRALRQLIHDIRKARAAAEVEVLGERAAMAKFRGAMTLSPTALRSIENQCRYDSWARSALQAVDEWRWAEENAVRYESVDLAPSRRKIQTIESTLGLSPLKTAAPIP
jgi:hypothetical protein